jgi:hypothetical protein
MSLRLVRHVVYRANVTLSVIRESRAEEPTGTWAAASEILVTQQIHPEEILSPKQLISSNFVAHCTGL